MESLAAQARNVIVIMHTYLNSNHGCIGYQQLHRRRTNRRDLLRLGATAVSGLWLTHLAESLARASEKSDREPKSLIMLWLQGGPSQLETFDPHPEAWIGGEVKAIPTSIKGIEIANTLPATAEQLKHATLVRSVVSKEGDHERASYHLKTGWRPDPTIVHPSLGSIVTYQSPDNLEIPRHVSILPGQWPARGGYLGPSYDAFQIGDPAKPIPNLSRRVAEEQFDQRLGPLLSTVESEFQRGRLAEMNSRRTLHQTATEQAVTMMSSSQLEAFDVNLEGQETLGRFGNTSFGRGCLAAVRLVSAGVRCVEVELDGWDSHINNHELQVGRATILDTALSALLQELDQRDLFNDTIVFCGGEFGRTPLINPAGGRDHWPHGFSVLMAGGRFRRGYVHGSTNANPDRSQLGREGDQPIDPVTLASDLVSVPDLHATLLHALNIDHELEMQTPIGRPLRWSDGNVVNALLDA